MSPLATRSVTRRSVLAATIVAPFALRSASAQDTGVYTLVGIGTDKRTPDDPELSDVLMISRVDTGAGTVRTLSIPRDLYVDIPGYGFGKINAAFNNAVKADPNQDWAAGAAGTVAAITHNFGLTIDGVAQTDMDSFAQMIDRLGGVTVDNPTAVSSGSWDFPAGVITLDGKGAEMFCRLRPDGDGGRVMRQHLVLRALLAQLQDPAVVPKIPDLVATMSDLVRTTIPPAIQARMIALIPNLNSEDVVFGNLDTQLSPGYTDGGAWIYVGDWSTLPGYVESWLNGTTG